MSRQLCYCCLGLPLGKNYYQPITLEIEKVAVPPYGEPLRDSFALCPACAAFVCSEVSRKMETGGGFDMIRAAVLRVKESYLHSRENKKK